MIITVVFEDADDEEFVIDEEDGGRLVTAVYLYDDNSKYLDHLEGF